MDRHIKKERRLSLKMFVNRINRHLPFLRPFINLLRFYTFKNYCRNYPASDFVYSDGSWIERRVTEDQKAIEKYLETRPIKDKRIFHVGIGSSSIAKKFASLAQVIDGITVIKDEKDYADSLSFNNYSVQVINKNDPSSLATLSGRYDYIIDNDIAAYACCKAHFREMLSSYLKLLNQNGEILVGAISLQYFDSGFPLPKFYLKKLSEELDFMVTEIPGGISIKNR